MCQSRVVRLKIVRSIDPTLDTSQVNTHSMASSKGWRLDEIATPYARVCVRVMGRIMRPLEWEAESELRVFIFAVEPSYSFLLQALETVE